MANPNTPSPLTGAYLAAKNLRAQTEAQRKIDLENEKVRAGRLEKFLTREIDAGAMDYILQSLRDPQIEAMFAAESAPQGTKRRRPQPKRDDGRSDGQPDELPLPSLAYEICHATKGIRREGTWGGDDADYPYTSLNEDRPKELVVMDYFLKRIGGVDVEDGLFGAALTTNVVEREALGLDSTDPERAKSLRKHRLFLIEFGTDIVSALEAALAFKKAVKKEQPDSSLKLQEKAFVSGFYTSYIQGQRKARELFDQWKGDPGGLAGHVEAYENPDADYFKALREDLFQARQNIEAGSDEVIRTTIRLDAGGLKERAEAKRATGNTSADTHDGAAIYLTDQAPSDEIDASRKNSTGRALG